MALPIGSPLAIPLVLGVTGHVALRDDDRDRLTRQVRTVVEEFRRAWPTTPIVLLTSLADGADRLVADCVLEAGGTLVVVLPVERSRYEATFRDDDSRREFGRLLADTRVRRVIVVPDAQDGGDAMPPDDASARQRGYLLAGTFIARHVQLLIALWDGAPAAAPGGTGQIVAFRLSGRLDDGAPIAPWLTAAADPFAIPERPLDAPQRGPVLQIVTPRTDATASTPAAGEVGEIRRLLPGSGPDAAGTPVAARAARAFPTLDAVMARIEQFNTDLAAMPASALPPPDARLDARLATLAAAGEAAGALAQVDQRRTYSALRTVFVIVFVAALCFETFAELAIGETTGSLVALAMYIALFAAADLQYRRIKGRAIQTRFQDYRAIAEGLRVQLAWRCAGIDEIVADRYLSKHADELRWIRDAVRAWGVVIPPVERPDEPGVDEWVDGQLAFYGARALRDRRWLARYRYGGIGCIAAALASAVAVVIWKSIGILSWAGGPVPHGIDHAGPHAMAGAIGALVVMLCSMIVLSAHVLDRVRDARREEEREDDDDAGGPEATSAELPVDGVPRHRFELASLWTGLAGGLAIVGALASVPAVVGQLRPGGIHRGIVLAPHAWLVVALGVPTLLGAFLHEYADQRAFAAHRKQYQRMARLFARGRAALRRRRTAADAAGTARLLIELGSEALAEHAEWLILHRERPLELPKAEI
jgi:hypothetical protein